MADTALSAALPARNTTAPTNPTIESNRDACVLEAFALWQRLHADRCALPNILDQTETGYVVGERALWDAIDRLETQIHDLPAITPADVACKLWVAIPHIAGERDEEEAAFRADLDWFVAQGDATDWNLRCIVSALVALKTMEA